MILFIIFFFSLFFHTTLFSVLYARMKYVSSVTFFFFARSTGRHRSLRSEIFCARRTFDNLYGSLSDKKQWTQRRPINHCDEHVIFFFIRIYNIVCPPSSPISTSGWVRSGASSAGCKSSFRWRARVRTRTSDSANHPLAPLRHLPPHDPDDDLRFILSRTGFFHRVLYRFCFRIFFHFLFFFFFCLIFSATSRPRRRSVVNYLYYNTIVSAIGIVMTVIIERRVFIIIFLILNFIAFRVFGARNRSAFCSPPDSERSGRRFVAPRDRVFTLLPPSLYRSKSSKILKRSCPN